MNPILHSRFPVGAKSWHLYWNCPFYMPHQLAKALGSYPCKVYRGSSYAGSIYEQLATAAFEDEWRAVLIPGFYVSLWPIYRVHRQWMTRATSMPYCNDDILFLATDAFQRLPAAVAKRTAGRPPAG